MPSPGHGSPFPFSSNCSKDLLGPPSASAKQTPESH